MVGASAFLTILYLTGTFRTIPDSTRYIALHYDGNGTATETLSAGEAAGSISVIAIVPYNSVLVSWTEPIGPSATYRTLALHKEQSLVNCIGKVTLREISGSEAIFEFKKGEYGCPICIVQGILMRMPIEVAYEPVFYNSTNSD